jgi:hypothetical protein
MSNSKPPALDLFGEPDINFLPLSPSSVKEKKEKTNAVKILNTGDGSSQKSAKKAVPANPDHNFQQAFLPGLSRRGRPRSKNPITAVERTAEHRRKRLAEGAKRVEMILAPEVARQLEALAEQFKEPRSEVIATLVTKAYMKVFKTKPTKV